jgi:hypothetical protein
MPDDLRKAFIAQFKKKSEDRTEQLLAREHKLVELTKEQKIKLEKLEKELQAKANYKAKTALQNKKRSETTGIPESLAGMDVINIAMLIGLIKSKAVRDGKEKDNGSLIDLFLGNTDKVIEKRKVNFKNIPFYFKHHPQKVLEEEKLEYTSEIVRQECEFMNMEIQQHIETTKKIIGKRVVFSPKSNSIDEVVKEGILIINDLIEGVIEELEEGTSDEIDSLLTTIMIVRNELFGLMNIFSYKKLVLKHVDFLTQINFNPGQYISSLDAVLIMHPIYKNKDLIPNVPKVVLESRLRCFTRDPKLEPINLGNIAKHCCCPSLVFLPVEEVLHYGLVGPYNNNPVTYMDISPWNFYILKEVRDDVRMWVLDPDLMYFIKTLRKYLVDYLLGTFRTFYLDSYGDHIYRSSCLKNYIFRTLARSLVFVSSKKFASFIRSFITKKSILVPTELDVFNTQEKVPIREDITDTKLNVIGKLFDSLFDEDVFLKMLKC